MVAQAVWIPEFIILWVQKPKLAVFTIVGAVFLILLIIGLYFLGGPYLTYDYSAQWSNDLDRYRREDLPRINGTTFVSIGGLQMRYSETRVIFNNLGKVDIPGPVISSHFFGYFDGRDLFPSTASGDRKAYSAIDPVVTHVPVQINTFGVNCSFDVNFTQKTLTSNPSYASELCFTVTWGYVQQPDPRSSIGETRTRECFVWFQQMDGCQYPAGVQPLGDPQPLNERKLKVMIRATTDPVVSLARVTKGTSALTDGVDRRDLGTHFTLFGALGLFFDIFLFLRDEKRYKTYFKAIIEACKNFKRNLKRMLCDPFCPDDDEELDEEQAKELQAQEELERQKKNPKKKHLDYEEFKKQQQQIHASGGANEKVKNALGENLLSENMLLPAAPQAKVVQSEFALKEKADAATASASTSSSPNAKSVKPNFDGKDDFSSSSPKNGGAYPTAASVISIQKKKAAAKSTKKVEPDTVQSALDLL